MNPILSACLPPRRALRHLLMMLPAILVLSPAAEVLAQESVYLGSRREAVHVTTRALYQRYVDGDARIEELTFPLSVFLPVTPELGLSLRASPARASGRALEPVGSVSDAQIGATYNKGFRRASLVMGLSANLPVGKTSLSAPEFDTSRRLSQNFYDFHLPILGQGLNVAQSLTVAVPIHERVVVGAGAAYQIKGPFAPSRAFPDEYDPGDELLLTAGLDVQLSSTSALSGDVTVTTYAGDTVGEEVVFGSGNRFTLTTQLLQYFRRDELRLIARYRSKGRSELPALDNAVTELERTVPNQAEIAGRYRLRLNENTTLALLAQGRYYSETSAFGSKSLVDVAVAPEYVLSSTTLLLTRLACTLGSFSGVSAGAGLAFTL